MKKRIMRCVAALLCACTVFGTGITCNAATARATGSLTWSLTKTRASAAFNYNEVGHQLKIEMHITVKDKSDGTLSIQKEGNTVWGNNTSVSQTVSAGAGYEYERMSVWGYVDGYVDVMKTSIKPD